MAGETQIDMTHSMEYRWNGPYGLPGSSRPGLKRTTKVHGNKGVMAERRAQRRDAAEARNATTPDGRRRSAARALGLTRHSDVNGQFERRGRHA